MCKNIKSVDNNHKHSDKCRHEHKGNINNISSHDHKYNHKHNHCHENNHGHNHCHMHSHGGKFPVLLLDIYWKIVIQCIQIFCL